MKQIFGIVFTILVFGVAFFAGRYSMHADFHEFCTSYDYFPNEDSFDDLETGADEMDTSEPDEEYLNEDTENGGSEVSQVAPEVTKENIINFAISKKQLLSKLSDPNLLFQAHAVPHRGRNGKILGFKILSIQPGSIYEEAGAKAGDVLTHIDGNPLNDIKSVQNFYNGIRQAKELRFSITREGVHKLLNVKISTP